jgi:protein ImuB
VLWIALHLPLLSLESFAATLPREAGSQALALTDGQKILSANAAARALGVKPGLKRATALALASQLVLGQASAARDDQALVAVAHAALAFTPIVVIPQASGAVGAPPPHSVLLDVQGSLLYFGGLKRLVQRLHVALAPLGHVLHTGIAPTALGASVLARSHRQIYCADRAAMHAALDPLPVWLIGPGREHWDALEGMGLRTLAELRRLPRGGLARRFGPAVLSELDRAYGACPDPLEPITLPPAFKSRLELFARADTTEQVLYGASVLLARLVLWLSAQHAFVRRFTLVMQHEPRWRRDAQTPTATTLDVALAEPSRDPAHLLVLLRERLAQIELPAPTIELRLHAEDIARRPPPNNELFPTARSESEGLTRLIERLQARLGPGQVQRIAAVADHRPERATVVHAQEVSQRLSVRAFVGSVAPQNAATPVRPVWLLQQPEPLREHASGPLLDGQPLQLLSGPERIESGWWDAALAERDYYIAQLADGALVWVYRARLPALAPPAPTWFLQGRFG